MATSTPPVGIAHPTVVPENFESEESNEEESVTESVDSR